MKTAPSSNYAFGMALIVLRRDGYDDIYREIDEIDPSIPEYIATSDHEREVSHFVEQYDDESRAIYVFRGTERIDLPRVASA